MSKISNLRQARKLKMREDADRIAAENRVKFGRTKEERQRVEEQNALEQNRLDQLKREIPKDKD